MKNKRKYYAEHCSYSINTSYDRMIYMLKRLKVN